MATWRDLSLPSRREVWRDLRGLRTGVVGPGRTNPDRSAVFTAALEQAQQFMEAAESAGPATRPVQIFYSLSQFGRAISAASSALSGEDWLVKGHGIGTKNLDVRNGLDCVQVVPHENGSLIGVARAMGVPPLAAKSKLSLGELWPLIPEGQSVPLASVRAFPALNFHAGALVHRNGKRWCRVSLMPIPPEVKSAADVDASALKDFLAHYPSLSGWSNTPDVPDVIQWQKQGGIDSLQIYLPSNLEAHAQAEEGVAEALERATLYRGPSDAYVFPALGGMTESVHPFLVWWAVLFGLSILARYEPAGWAAMIDIDTSGTANAIENLLEHAIGVIPHLALIAIKDVSGS
ncbi:YaaC family protein [Streptomyces sp. NBC_01498]|uniref:YaaC family protein n=1 Tax=Streptomyces sp. NBC_01498 TaxID=2975870 RepID=UPI002E7B157B|nr:YaaC family protein [Streptomyces sp. NBC_01498]